LSARHTILIVDDETFVRDSLVDLLENEGYMTLTAGNAKDALKLLDTEPVSAVVTDLRMPSGDGLFLLEETRKENLEVPVILLTGVGTVQDAVKAMKSGAYDFIQKPVDPEQFVLLIRRAAEHHDLLSEVRHLRHTVQDLRGPTEMIGDSQALAAVRRLIAQVARTSATVLITGESGTGKELVAVEIHKLSDRAKENFVSVNCAAIPENLFESEFFGHRRGSFTSALSDREGRFAEAEGGTVALDEIGILKPEMQAKLLRVLETGEYQVVGESRTRVANVRVIAITNEDLDARVREGAFRRDLYYRLNVFPIEVPPLRKRKEDIPALAAYFVARAKAGSGRAPVPAEAILSRAACEVLSAYDWPGNVREIRNVMERAAILAGTGPIEASILKAIIGAPQPQKGIEEEGDLQIRKRVDSLERKLISEALERSGGRKRDAAVLLGIDPKNLGYYLRKHDLLGKVSEGGEEGDT